MAQRVTQSTTEVLRQEDNIHRATQITTEVLRQEANQHRATQVTVEVLRENLIPSPTFEGWGMPI